MDLIERDEQLDTLVDAVEGLARGEGRVVLIGAEAGAGKSSLLRALADRLPEHVLLRIGRCDDLSTPASFAPLWDMAETLPRSITAALSTGGRSELFAAVRDELASSPCVLAVDDAQWADEATLDLLRHLGRRIDALPVVICIAYRSDEIDRDHALRGLLGELGPIATRLGLAPLTRQGVERLLGDGPADLADVYARTGGNPFFVAEVLARPDEPVPAAVGDAVLARARALPASAWDVLDLVALTPEGLPLDVIPELGTTAENDADVAVERGLLDVVGDRLRCRHDIVRSALGGMIPPVRRRRFHGSLLDMLEPRAATAAEVAQLAHHAVAAEDEDRAVRYSVRAAERARADGAHRQAARHFSNALRYRSRLTPAELERVLEGFSYEAYYTNEMSAALGSALELLDRRRSDPVDRGRTLWWCSRLAHFAGDDAQAVQLVREALAASETVDPLYERYGHWWLANLLHDQEGVEAWGRSTAAMAIEMGELGIAAHVLNSVGIRRSAAGDPVGPELMAESLELAKRGGSLEQTARAYNNLAHEAMHHRRLAEADRWFEEGLAWTGEHDLTFWWGAMLDSRSMLRLCQCRWDEALSDAETTLSVGGDAVGMQVCAAAAKATILVRRGDDEAADALDALSRIPSANAEDVWYAAAVRAEQSWLAGTGSSCVDADIFDLLRPDGGRMDVWHAATVAFWLHKIDPSLLDGVDLGVLPDAVGRELSGDNVGAARCWSDLGCDFEAAVLRGMSDDHTELRAAFEVLGQLGATATIAALRRDAAARGVRSVPRGARSSTIADPAGLTERQAEVLELLGERLTNAQIAERLVISEKTAGHHVSAILTKLGVGTRTEAGEYARARRRNR